MAAVGRWAVSLPGQPYSTVHVLPGETQDCTCPQTSGGSQITVLEAPAGVTHLAMGVWMGGVACPAIWMFPGQQEAVSLGKFRQKGATGPEALAAIACLATSSKHEWGSLPCHPGTSSDNRKLCPPAEFPQKQDHGVRSSSRYYPPDYSDGGRLGGVLPAIWVIPGKTGGCALQLSSHKRGITGLEALASVACQATSGRGGWNSQLS